MPAVARRSRKARPRWQRRKAARPAEIVTALRAVSAGFRAWGSAVEVTRPLADGSSLQLRDRELRVLHRPGHSPSDTVFLDEGRGILLYLNQEGRGIGLANKIRAYELQDEGFDTVEANERLGFKADQRDYGVGVQILRALGVCSMRLLSNNPRKLVGIEGYGLTISEWMPLEIPAHDGTQRYLKTKKEKLGHKLSSV